MTIRTFYFKVSDVERITDWWSEVLGISPHKKSRAYGEFKVGEMRLGFVLNDWGEKYEGNRGVAMFNTDSEKERDELIDRMVKAGGSIEADNRTNEALKSASVLDPFGNEVEIGFLTHD